VPVVFPLHLGRQIVWAAIVIAGWTGSPGRDISARQTQPQTVGNLRDTEGVPLSDHDAITLDFTLREGRPTT
jgi:hypothetical protein